MESAVFFVDATVLLYLLIADIDEGWFWFGLIKKNQIFVFSVPNLVPTNCNGNWNCKIGKFKVKARLYIFD